MIIFQGAFCVVQKADIYIRNLKEIHSSGPQRMELLFCEEKKKKASFQLT